MVNQDRNLLQRGQNQEDNGPGLKDCPQKAALYEENEGQKSVGIGQ